MRERKKNWFIKKSQRIRNESRRRVTLISGRQGLEEFDDNHHCLVVASLDDRWNFLKGELEQLAQRQDAELEIMDPGE